jgi:hypothetical protein
MKSPQERQADRRRQKLEEVEKQIRTGSLVVRQMTAKERAENPARPRDAKRGGGRR